MLTREQEKVLENACELYLEARQSENSVRSLELFNQAFGILIDYIDEVDDIYYEVVFANCIEALQRKGNLDFGEVIVQAKKDIYVKTLTWFLDATEYKTEFKAHLFIAFDALGKMFLLGEDYVRQSDYSAYICYQCIVMLGIPGAEELYLQDFVKDPVSGEWKYTAPRRR